MLIQRIKSVFYASKREKPTDENIMQLLIPSFIGIAACAVCLVGLTFAWFTASVSTSPTTITASNFSMSVSVTPEENREVTESDGITTVKFLSAGQYTVTLTKAGDGNGYCKIKANDLEKRTEAIEDSLSFTVVIDEAEAVYQFIPVWGSFSGESDVSAGSTVALEEQQPPISENSTDPAPDETTTSTPSETPSETTSATMSEAPSETAPEPTPEVTYTIKPGDTLGKIAEMFNTTVQKLADYNGIENQNVIRAGKVLRIPPEDYKIPD